MMAFRVRVLHSLVLTLVGLSFIIYSSYYANPVQVYHIEQQHEDTVTNNTKLAVPQQIQTEVLLVTQKQELPSQKSEVSIVHPTLSSSSSSSSSSSLLSSSLPSSSLSLSSSSSSSSKAITSRIPVIQSIPKKGESENKNVKPPEKGKGILTRAIYEAGHNISNPDICPELGARLKLLVAITSAPQHTDARMAVRQTWGHYGLRKDVAIMFMVGATSKPDIEAGIVSEAEIYGDIVQGRFVDSYDNLTLKTVSILEWVDNYCSRARFVLKTDDDMFINMLKLLEFIDNHGKFKRTIFGRLAKKWKPIRNSKSKYYASVDQFPPSVFPDFTTGPAYLLTGDTIHELYENALDRTYLKLEDVFTTGIVAQSINIKRVHINEFLNKRIPFNVCNIKKGISIHMVKFHEQFDLWKKLLDGKSKCK